MDESIKIKHEEEKEQLAQEIWVHARPDLSYREVLAMVDGKQAKPEAQQQVNEKELTAIITTSKGILNSFCPN